MVNKIAGRIPAIDVLEESSPPDLDEILSLQQAFMLSAKK